MRARILFLRTIATLILCAFTVPVRAQSREQYTNLKVLPKDIKPEDLRGLMNSFTRALGVRCIHCHVGEEGKPFRFQDFALDDKPTKRKAREMLRMVQDINDKYLDNLEVRAVPPVRVVCITCHRGVTQPRTLQDVLTQTYQAHGIDSTLARYQGLRDRFYGRAAYDFGEVPLADVAGQIHDTGHMDDALRLLAVNVEMNPKSAFAQRQFASASIAMAYRTAGADSGAAAYAGLKARYGPNIVTEDLLNAVGYELIGVDRVDTAVAAFKLNAAEHPSSANAYDSLAEAYAKRGDWKLASQNYAHSLELDPTNEHAKHELETIKTQKVKPKR